MSRIPLTILFSALIYVGFAAFSYGTEPIQVASDIVFQIGRPDAVCWEFQGYADWRNSRDKDGISFRYVVGKNRAKDWVAMHPSTRDFGAAGESFTTQTEFELQDEPPDNLSIYHGFLFRQLL